MKKTKTYFQKDGIVALKADRDKSPEVDQLLTELGNSSHGIPYYAVFSGASNESVHFGGNYLTSQTVLDAIARVQGENEKPGGAANTKVAEAAHHKPD